MQPTEAGIRLVKNIQTTKKKTEDDWKRKYEPSALRKKSDAEEKFAAQTLDSKTTKGMS